MSAVLSAATDPLPLLTIEVSRSPRFSVERYHRLIASGHFSFDDRIELLEGYLVTKMAKNPPHSFALMQLNFLLADLLRPEWLWQLQEPVTLAASEPEPDVTVFRPPLTAYASRHPNPADIVLLIEVSDSSLATDQVDKFRIYARNGIANYWIVNLVDRQIEVYGQPSGPSAEPEYAETQTYVPGETVPVVLDGQVIGQIAVNDVIRTA